MAFCTECGASIPEGIRFCTSCGTPAPETAQPAPAVAADQQPFVPEPAPPAPQIPAPQPQAYAQPAPQYQQPVQPPPPQYQPVQPPVQTQPAPAPAKAADGEQAPSRTGKYAVMGLGSYIGHGLLFAIPGIGWIFCIILAFASKKLNKRNYARATLIFTLIGALIAVALFFVVSWIWEVVAQHLNETSGGAFDSFGLFDAILSLFK